MRIRYRQPRAWRGGVSIGIFAGRWCLLQMQRTSRNNAVGPLLAEMLDQCLPEASKQRLVKAAKRDGFIASGPRFP